MSPFRRFLVVTMISLFVVSIAHSQERSSSAEIMGSVLELNGHRLWLGEEGRGEVVVLIPGGPGFSHRRIEPHFRDLSSQFRLVVYDPLGRGRSGRIAANLTYRLWDDIEDLEALRRFLGAEKINLVAHSAGCVIAGRFAEKYPERVSHLVLASGALSSEHWQKGPIAAVNSRIEREYPQAWSRLQEIVRRGKLSSDDEYQSLMGEAWAKLNSRGPKPESQRPAPREDDWNPQVYFSMLGNDPERHVGGEFEGFDLFPSLKKANFPLLLTYGAEDSSFPGEMLQEIQQQLPRADFRIFAHSQHSPHRDESAAYLGVLRDFLRK